VKKKNQYTSHTVVGVCGVHFVSQQILICTLFSCAHISFRQKGKSYRHCSILPETTRTGLFALIHNSVELSMAGTIQKMNRWSQQSKNEQEWQITLNDQAIFQKPHIHFRKNKVMKITKPEYS